MKHQFFFTLLLLLLVSNTYSQTLLWPVGVTGFDLIGVVAPIDNYQQTHFQNPALLVRGNHKLDAFATHSTQSSVGFQTIMAGSMITFKTNNAIGVGLNRVFLEKGAEHYRLTAIPLSYARNLYKNKWMGFSAGLNLNILHHDIESTGGIPVQVSNRNETGLTGGFGLHGYRIFPIKEKEILIINAGFSINDIGSNMSSFNSTFHTTMRVGGLARWQKIFSNGNSINLDGAYQYDKHLELPSTLYYHKVGGEFRYVFEAISTSIATKGGFVWEMVEGNTLYRYNTFGGRVKYKNIYLDVSYLPDVVHRARRNSSWNLGIGYQKSLN